MHICGFRCHPLIAPVVLVVSLSGQIGINVMVHLPRAGSVVQLVLFHTK